MPAIYLNEDDCQSLTSILYLSSMQDDEVKDFYYKIINKINNASRKNSRCEITIDASEIVEEF
jgi:predicted DNA-binding ArsR family transcriptional regulator